MGVDAQMFLLTDRPLDEAEVRRKSVRLVEAFGTDVLFVIRPDDFHKKGRHALEIVSAHRQDGPDVVPGPGEQMIEVTLWGRYYGKGYERGRIHDYIAVAEWLEANIAGARVWYGGDSSGICAEPFGRSAREGFAAHFNRVGHDPYLDVLLGSSPNHPYCEFCRQHMRQYGFGNNYAAFSCGGCGHKLVRRDGILSEPEKACPRCMRTYDKKEA